jgi:hypothetical protein
MFPFPIGWSKRTGFPYWVIPHLANFQGYTTHIPRVSVGCTYHTLFTIQMWQDLLKAELKVAGATLLLHFYKIYYSRYILTVLDLVSQVRDVVLVKCIFSSGKPQGSGFWKGEYMRKGMEMGRSVYEQPGTKVDRILSQQGGFQVSKGKRKRAKEE